MDGPHRLLDSVEAGVDVFTMPLINRGTDHGFALVFSFDDTQEVETHSKPHALALDMWSDAYATDLSPLREGCQCYTCKHHHRAYLSHLLKTKEMLSWVLLQLHNYHVIDAFFENIRLSIESGNFSRDKAIFFRTYENVWPAKTGQEPRSVRTVPKFMLTEVRRS